jgi:uncharacterized membrane protein
VPESHPSMMPPDDRLVVSAPPARVGRWLLVVSLSAVVLGVFFRCFNIDRKVFWEDEILGVVHTLGYTEAEIVEASPQMRAASDIHHFVRPSAADASRPLGATIRSLAAEDPQHPPAYYLIARLWTNVFGHSVMATRGSAVLFGVLALPLIFWLSLELFGSKAAASIALALVAVSPFYVLYAQEAREYSLWTLAIAVAGILVLRGVRGAGSWTWAGYAVAVAVGLYVYPLTGLVAIGFFVYVLFAERLRITRAVVSCFVANLCALIAFAPWLAVMRASSGLGQGMATIMRAKLTPGAFAFILARDLRFPYFDLGAFRLGPLGSTAINAGLTAFCVVLSAFALVALVRRRPFSVWGFVVVGLCLPMTVLLLEDLFVRGHFVYQARYFIPALLGIQLAVADLFAARMLVPRPAGRPVWVGLFGLILAGEVISCAISARADTWWNKAYERSPAVAAIVNASPHPVVTGDYYSPSILALGFYLDPDVQLRIVARCTQCTVAPPPAPPADLAGFGSVFVIRATPPPPGPERWIDPQTFPARPDPLNLFTAT